MSRKLEGKIAVVTGGTTGIGFAAAKRFADEGAQVVITGRRQSALDAAVARISNAVGIRADSANLADLDVLFTQLKAQMGRIDVLFVNAGGGSMVPLGSITEEQYEETFGRNVKGVLFTVQKALPLLAEGASVILTGSTTGSTGNAGLSVYGASKAAVRAFARNWILDLQGRNIRINTLSPGATRTEGLLAAAGPDAAQQQGFIGHLRHRCRWVESPIPTRSPRRRCSWRATTRASSPAARCSSTVDRRRSEVEDYRENHACCVERRRSAHSANCQ